jgi:hypothetical protein
LLVLPPHPAKVQSKARVGKRTSRETACGLARCESNDVLRNGAAFSRSECSTILDARASTSFALPVPGEASRSKKRNGSPSHGGVMRRARVIIKPKSGLNREEFLTADNLCVSFPGQRDETCADAAGLNDALTNQRLWLTIR